MGIFFPHLIALTECNAVIDSTFQILFSEVTVNQEFYKISTDIITCLCQINLYVTL